MNAPFDPYALTDTEVLPILKAAQELVLNPSRNSRAWLDLLTAVNDADGNDALTGTVNDWRDYHGLDPVECLICSRDRCNCDQIIDDAKSELFL